MVVINFKDIISLSISGIAGLGVAGLLMVSFIQSKFEKMFKKN